jgi:uncharacterized membrane protein
MFESSELFIIARILHLFGVILWIGGVAFVTTVLLPAIINSADKQQGLERFEQLEGKFSLQAKITTLITMLSGVYMLEYLNAWYRYFELNYWWLHMMTLVWLLFSVVLFVLEPLFLHQWFKRQAAKNSQKTMQRILTMHRLLLSLSLIAVGGAIAGVRGF